MHRKRDRTDKIMNINKLQLGSIPLSTDILDKSGIGIWAFELDEGKPPRMYVDDTMLKLIGLTEQISPEETYHAWYDNIDNGSYSLVSEAVDKMIAGEHAEVQYPWHYPDGHTIVVRCGGMRNFDYKDGVRIEGTHRNVSKVFHFDETEFQRVKKQEIDMKNYKLRADALAFISDHEGNVDEFLDFFGDRILKMADCDQVIFRDINGKRVIYNAPDIIDMPSDVCSTCPFVNITDKEIYSGGVVIMNDCRLGVRGIKTPSGCKVKSSVMQHIYTNGKISGLLSFHYYKKQHTFTNDELEMLKTLATYLGLLLGRIEADNLAKKVRKMQHQEDMETIEGLASEYLSLYYVNLDSNVFRVYSIDGKRLPDTKALLTQYTDTFEALRKFAVDSVHPDDRQIFIDLNTAKVRQMLANRKKITFRYRRDYGQGYLWSEMDIVKYEAPDTPASTLIIGFAERDKEIKHEQEMIKEREEALTAAQSANNAKTLFMNSMSHDIRTPMNAIIGYTSMTQKYIDDKEKALGYLSKIESAGNNLLKLINQVLDMSRIESGKITLNEEPTDIIDKAFEMTEIMGHAAEAKSIQISTIIKHVRKRKVYADAGRVNQIIMNILGNAVKYTPEGGQITYTVTQEECTKAGHATYRFTIEDNGIGMSKEYLTTIFEPFSRENTSTISKIQGTGLGMSIVHKLVEFMGGNIAIESEPGKGTKVILTITFRLQEKDNKNDEAIPFSRDTNILRGKRVLLVEDNEMNREIATMILEEQGIIVETAEDGDIAVEKMRLLTENGNENYFDFILMDIQMPTMDGYEATRQIRRLGIKLPVIAMTANAFAEDRQAAINAGMDEHIAKPIDVMALWETLIKFVTPE